MVSPLRWNAPAAVMILVFYEFNFPITARTSI